MAKDTEKLIRQLSLISFLMAERRPVSALEIKQDVEGYSQMNDEAFARRFYADRAVAPRRRVRLRRAAAACPAAAVVGQAVTARRSGAAERRPRGHRRGWR